mgnify:CR=1 FL=1
MKAYVLALEEKPPPSLVEALDKIIKGLQALGDGLTILIRFMLAAIGIQVPEIAIRIGTIVLVILLLWRLGNAVSKIVLYALIFLLISLFAGLVPAIINSLFQT